MTVKKINQYLTLLLVLFSGTGFAHTPCSTDEMITIKEAWARANVAQNGNSAVYMDIHNGSVEDDQLVGVEADVCGKVELHQTVQNGDVFKMVPVKGITVPAQGSVQLKPGGYHIMLIGLHEGLKEGAVVQVTLHFKNAPSKVVLADVKKMSGKKSKCNCDCGCAVKKSKKAKAKKHIKKKAAPKVETCHHA